MNPRLMTREDCAIWIALTARKPALFKASLFSDLLDGLDTLKRVALRSPASLNNAGEHGARHANRGPVDC